MTSRPDAVGFCQAPTQRSVFHVAARPLYDGRVSALLVGRIIAERYRVVEPIGKGGMADVYRGEHVHMRKRVAIKVLNPATERLPELVARFEREAVAGAQVHHPHVAIATDFGKLEDGSFYLILEYIRGTTLRALLDERGTLSAGRSTKIARQLAAGLGAAHDAGVVHRDVKPANVMLVEGTSDFVKLIDFGFAKVEVSRLSATGDDDPEAPRTPLTGIGQMFGTPPYMAPESIGGMDVVDARSDLYSLGVVLYEMLSGRRPFEIEDRVELFGRKTAEPAPPLSTWIEVPPPLEAIVMRLLERDPSARFADAHEVEEALAELSATNVPTTLPPPPITSSLPPDADVTQPARARRSLGGRRAVLAAIAIGAVVVVTIVAPLLIRRTPAASDVAPPDPSASFPSAPSATEPSAPVAPEASAVTARTDLWHAVAKRDYRRGATALLALGDGDPAAFREPDVVGAAANIAVAIDLLDPPLATSVFDLFAHKLGSDGTDVLYEIVRTRGGDKGGARRAMELLRDDQVLAHASPAMRVALELRQAACPRKRELFERAAAEGDQRVLTEMRALRASACGKKAGPCCFKTDKALFDAIAALKQRVDAQRPAAPAP